MLEIILLISGAFFRAMLKILFKCFLLKILGKSSLNTSKKAVL